MKQYVLPLLLALTVTNATWAQSIGPGILNSAGGTAIIGVNEFDWSIGEMTLVKTFYDTINSSVILTQGLLQPAGYTNESVHNTSLLANQLQVFPNPASSVVNIVYTSSIAGTLTYKLMDMTGQVLKNSTIAVQLGKTSTQINVADLADAIYMLEITTNPGSAASESVTYKIEKLN